MWNGPEELDHKRISVSAFFDPKDRLLSYTPDMDFVVGIQFSEEQVQALKRRGLWKRGYVHIVGTFEFLNHPKGKPYRSRIVRVTEFTRFHGDPEHI